MSRRCLPAIDPKDLRDHADEARIARVWQRIEHDLTGFEAPPKRSPSFTYLAVAAAFDVGYTSQDWARDATNQATFLDLNPGGQWLVLPPEV